MAYLRGYDGHIHGPNVREYGVRISGVYGGVGTAFVPTPILPGGYGGGYGPNTGRGYP
jgi:hypothetical protein